MKKPRVLAIEVKASDEPIHQPFDTPLRWLIESSDGGAYLVDLGANNERGLCPCKWFSCETGPALRRGDFSVPYCRHYGEALRRFTRWGIHDLASRDRNTREHS